MQREVITEIKLMLPFNVVAVIIVNVQYGFQYT